MYCVDYQMSYPLLVVSYAPQRSDKGIKRKFTPFYLIINYLSLYHYYSALLQWVLHDV